MIKPQGYDNAQGYTEFEQLEKGGHICIIKKVEEGVSSKGKNMLKIFLDTAPEDKQPNFYMQKYNNDTRENKTWGCIKYIPTDGSDFGNRELKTFNEAVQGSNGNFQIDWANYEKQMVGKKVCGVFRVEEYEDNYGEVKKPIKIYTFRTIQDFKDGKVKVPKDREAKKKNTGYGSYNDQFPDVTPVDDGDMPF